jgi:hypothetical protein
MRRLALEDIKLSDGTLIPKGSSLLVSSHKMWDPDVYPNPETFDPYRFLRLRDTPGHETSAQLVSPSPEHLGFGYGKHACPGRFFAANEVKIALCHILLKYDFKLPDGYTQTVRRRGISLSADPSAGSSSDGDKKRSLCESGTGFLLRRHCQFVICYLCAIRCDAMHYIECKALSMNYALVTHQSTNRRSPTLMTEAVSETKRML